MTEKVHLEGMNGTAALVHVTIANDVASADTMTGFLRSLAQRHINMRMFIGAESSCGVQLTCCVADADATHARALADSTPAPKGCIELREDVALVSIFPHRFSLQTVGLALMTLAEAGVVLHGFSSSLSALTFITDHARLQEVFAAFQATFDFSNSPPRMTG